jgi:hypothetical protein
MRSLEQVAGLLPVSGKRSRLAALLYLPAVPDSASRNASRLIVAVRLWAGSLERTWR